MIFLSLSLSLSLFLWYVSLSLLADRLFHLRVSVTWPPGCLELRADRERQARNSRKLETRRGGRRNEVAARGWILIKNRYITPIRGLATGGLRSIEPNKAASIGASPQVAASSIIGRHEPPLDNEPADAPLRGLRSPLLKRIRCLRAGRCPLPSTGIVLHAPLFLSLSFSLSLSLSLLTRSADRCRALLRNFT